MTVRWRLGLLPHVCGKSSLQAFLHNGLVFAEAVRAKFIVDRVRNRDLDFRPWYGGLVVYHKFWCKNENRLGFSGCRCSDCGNMIRKKNLRVIRFVERFTESECQKKFAFKEE
jgi:hypothetical protein